MQEGADAFLSRLLRAEHRDEIAAELAARDERAAELLARGQQVEFLEAALREAKLPRDQLVRELRSSHTLQQLGALARVSHQAVGKIMRNGDSTGDDRQAFGELADALSDSRS